MTLAQSGQWVPVPLSDGSVRHDWEPHPQPPSPDGTPGSWRVVPGATEGYGTWTWFPASAPAPGPAPAAKRTPARPRAKAALAVAGGLVVLLFLALLTRGGGGSSGSTGTSRLSDSQKRSTLITAADSYMAAMLAGNGGEAARYLDPKVCGPADRSGTGKLASFLAKQAPGAKAKVTKVEVRGDDGTVSGYQLSGSAPDPVKSAVAEGYTAGGDFSWHLRADKWVFDSEC